MFGRTRGAYRAASMWRQLSITIITRIRGCVNLFPAKLLHEMGEFSLQVLQGGDITDSLGRSYLFCGDCEVPRGRCEWNVPLHRGVQDTTLVPTMLWRRVCGVLSGAHGSSWGKMRFRSRNPVPNVSVYG